MGWTMSTRDRIEEAVKALLREIAKASDDEDVTQQAREDIKRLYFGIHWQLGKFNQPDGPDPFTGGGPTREDLEGTVRHDIG